MLKTNWVKHHASFNFTIPWHIPPMRLRPDSVYYILFLTSLGGLTPLSIDMGLPALDAIGHSLNASPASVALTLSFFLFGFAVGPVLLGPMSDCLGRRPVLLFSTVLFTVSGLGCFLAGSLPILLFWRLLQGIGSGGGAVISLAIVRDLYTGAMARQRLSFVVTIGALAPMIAPTIGALIMHYSNWRAIYGVLFALGLIVLLVIWFFFDESNKNLDQTALDPDRLFVNYLSIFRNRICLIYTLVSSLHFGCIFSYVTSSPLVMMTILKVSPTNYGYTFASTAAGIMFGAFLNGKLSARGYSGKALLRMGLSLSSLTGLGLLGCCLAKEIFVATLLPLLVVNTFCLGFVSPNATQAVMAPVPEMAGLASAVLSSVRMMTGGLAGILVSFLFDGHTPLAMAECMSGFSLFSLYLFVRHTNSLARELRTS